MHACLYVCMHACMYVCMHACMFVCMHACMHLFYVGLFLRVNDYAETCVCVSCRSWGFRTVKMARDGLIAKELLRQGRTPDVKQGGVKHPVAAPSSDSNGGESAESAITANPFRPPEMGIIGPCQHALAVSVILV